ncbi:MAG: hypothetical protein CMK59_01620 [Proteobacteria bacterium]|nr:hypothetical protein [Pseudomonadota bacterium]
MAKQKQRPSQEIIVDEEQITQLNSNTSNAVQKDQLPRSKKGTAEGLANYQAALGKWLGKELYQAVAPFLSQEDIGTYADAGLMSGISYLIGQLESNAEDTIDPAVFENLTHKLSEEYGHLASKYLDKHGVGLVNALGGWVDAHPRTIVGIAILAAAAAIISDMDIPELKQKFKLSDRWAIKIGANIGSFRNIALTKIEAELEHRSGPLVGAVKLTHHKEKGNSINLSGGYEEKDRSLKADVTVTEDGVEAYGLKGLLKHNEDTYKANLTGGPDKNTTLNLEVESPKGNRTVATGVNYDFEKGILLTDRSTSQKVAGGDLTTSTKAEVGGKITQSADWEGNVAPNLSMRQGIAQTTTNGINPERTHTLGGTYDKGGLTVTLDGLYKENNHNELDGSIKYNTDAYTVGADVQTGTGKDTIFNTHGERRFGRHRIGGDSKINLSRGELKEIGGYYGFKDPNSFSSFLAEYRYDLGSRTHKFDATIEKELMNIKWRAIEKLRVSPEEMTSSTELLGAYAINNDYSIIGGGRFDYSGRQGRGTFIPEVGIQYKDVPIVIEYNPEQKSVGVGIKLKF